MNGQVPVQWEMYDLLEDPLKTNNLAYRLQARRKAVQAPFERLRAKLDAVQARRLQPLA